MGNVNSKNSPTDLGPSPAEKVLLLPELVSIIFGHLAADSDLQSLTNARAVCSLWKREVFITLRSNLALMPCIVVETPNDLRRSIARDDTICNWFWIDGPVKSLESAVDSLMPGYGFPLKLVVNEWTLGLESFIRDFSKEIVSFGIFGCETFPGFPTEFGSIELPALRRVAFWAEIGSGRDEGKLREFVKAVGLWNALVKDSRKLKTCDFLLNASLADSLRPIHWAFDQVEWSQVGDLKCTFEFYSELCASNELSALHDLSLFANQTNDRRRKYKRFSLKKTPNLRYLLLHNDNYDYWDLDWILDHPMRRMTYLSLSQIAISGTQSPSKLIPNLEEIHITDYRPEEEVDIDMEARPFDYLTRSGGVFKKAVKLILSEDWMNLNQGIGSMAGRLCDSFPNLKYLEWESMDDGDFFINNNNNNALCAAPVIFSRLEFLTSLDLRVNILSEREVVELVSGISLEDIPEAEDSWPAALVDNPHSIKNLKNLEKFKLEAKLTVNSRHTRFLFAAAFRTMQTLEELCFRFINFEDATCATEWEQMGRMITLRYEDEE